MKRFLLSTAGLALTGGMAAADYNLTILHTNDFHARFEPISKFDSGCSDEDDAAGELLRGRKERAFVDRAEPVTRAWVIHPDVKSDNSRRAAEPALAEAIALAAALPGLEVVGSEVVRLPRIHPGHLFGTGKIAELKSRMKAAEVELVLVDGVVDLIVGLKLPHLSLRTQPLCADPFVCLVGPDHAALPVRLPAAAFCELEYLDVSPSGTGLLGKAIDEALAGQALHRRVAATCSSFMAVPEMLRGTGLAALVPSRLLPLYSAGSVRYVALDFELPPYEISLWWHNVTHADPQVRWLRAELVALASAPA